VQAVTESVLLHASSWCPFNTQNISHCKHPVYNAEQGVNSAGFTCQDMQVPGPANTIVQAGRASPASHLHMQIRRQTDRYACACSKLPDLAAITLYQSKHSSSLSSGVIHLMLPALNVAAKCFDVVHLTADGILTALQVLQPAHQPHLSAAACSYFVCIAVNSYARMT